MTKNNNVTAKKIAEGDESLVAGFGFNQQAPVLMTTCSSNIFDIYLDEPIREPSYYRNAFQTLRNASEGDLVRIFINTPGGRLDSAIQMINSIKNSSADVLGVLEGDASSAGGLILLNCENIQVAPFSTIMVHTASYGTIGTAKNVKDQVDFYDAEVARLIRSTYKYFLTDEEIEEVLNNKEIWLNDEQISVRLDHMFRMQAEQEEQKIQEVRLAMEEETESKPVEKTPKKSTPRKRSSKSQD